MMLPNKEEGIADVTSTGNPLATKHAHRSDFDGLHISYPKPASFARGSLVPSSYFTSSSR